MVIANCDQLIENLEQQELDAPTGIAAPETYQQLLALYLYENDLCNAKYLWKRIPKTVRDTTPELSSIWQVAQSMWKRDYSGIYSSLNAIKWSDTVASIMQQVQEKIRQRAVELVTQAYTAITLNAVATMTGLSLDICTLACQERGWTVDADTQIVHPVKIHVDDVVHTNTEDQLSKLTDFVSFLEN